MVRSWTAWYEVGRKLDPLGTKLVRVGTKLVRSWYEVSTKLVRSWDEIGTKLGRSWYGNCTKSNILVRHVYEIRVPGTKLVQNPHNGTKLVRNWYDNLE